MPAEEEATLALASSEGLKLATASENETGYKYVMRWGTASGKFIIDPKEGLMPHQGRRAIGHPDFYHFAVPVLELLGPTFKDDYLAAIAVAPLRAPL